MFTALANKLSIDLEQIKKVILWQDNLRNTIHSINNSDVPAINIETDSLNNLRSSAPNKLGWQIFDHCAGVTRIYALFENAICELIVEYLGLVTRVSPRYFDLCEGIRIQHRVGVGQILHKWSSTNPLYSHLVEREIPSGLADGLREQTYTLLPDAFLVDSENYRVKTINRLFSGLGFQDAFASVKRSAPVIEFCRTQLSGSETAESFLDGFVKTRNEASHGSLGMLASSKEIVNYCDFVLLVIMALGRLLRTNLIRIGITSGLAQELGKVMHVYSNNIVGIRATISGQISIGDNLYGIKNGVDPIKIISLRIIDNDMTSIVLTPNLDFGAGLDVKLLNGSSIIKWNL